ncbi:MAG: hypothetical protein V1767_04605 [Chloroflexota bacterium]
MVTPKFSDGTKVRIKTKDTRGQLVYREFERYENQSGVILNSKSVVAYYLRPSTESIIDRVTTLRMYSVKLEEGITIHNLTEYLLEQI